MTKIKTFAGSAAALVVTVTLSTSSAFAHGMGGHRGSSGSNMGTVTTTKTTKIIEHHDRFRDRRFFAFGYVAPDYVCVWRRTLHGLVKICPNDWY